MTDETATILEAPRFSIVRVLEDSGETLFRIFPRLLAITAIVSVPLLMWLVLGGTSILVRFASVSRLEGDASPFDAVTLILMLLIVLISLVINAAVSDAAFKHLLGAEDDLLANLSRAFLAAPVVIGAGLFVTILLTLAVFMLALATGLLASIHWVLGALLGLCGMAGLAILMVKLWVLIPVIVIEQTGPVECFKRSNWLSEGNRWKVFAVILIVYVPELMVKALLLVAVPFAGAVLVGILNIVISGGFIAFNAVFAAMIYGHLRAIKEGSGSAELADVFS